ncbi:MAG: hypothetical protein KKA38_00875 [Euryarchaeota archaeon]|nr:hypothetical protein [Euryarchaeota archaeon]MBU4607079.1 hypothetical protein [Euryarchaeota archaeon]MBV1755763.1 hypothetical protein [Methanobacterium sp.]
MDINTKGRCKTPFHHKISGLIKKFPTIFQKPIVIPERAVIRSVGIFTFG